MNGLRVPPHQTALGRQRFSHSWAIEALLLVGLYLASEFSRGLARGGEAAAERHAATIARLERHMHLFGEAAIQRAAHHVYGLPPVLGYAYLTLHLAVTVAVLAWVYRYRREAYPLLRNTLALASLLAVVGYALFPTAPPRLAGVGIGDTVSGATSINLGSTLVSSLYNPYAAVPSMHVGFSLLVGATIWRLGRRRLWQLAGLIYPVVVLFVIVATGNHFFLDAAAGAAVAAAAATLVAVAAAVRHRVRDDVHKPRLRLRERCQARPRSTDCRTPERRLSPLAEAVGCGQPECVFSIERSRSPAVGDELLRSSRSQAKRLSQQED